MSPREQISPVGIEDAEALFLTLMGPDATPKDWERYEHLKQSSAAYRAVFLRLEETWDALGEIGAGRLSETMMQSDDEEYSRYASPGNVIVGDASRGSRGHSKPSLHKWVGEKRWALIAVAATVLIVAGLNYQYFFSRSPEIVRYATSTSEHTQINLPDGSSLELGGRTTVEVQYTDAVRLIELRTGEVLASVAHDEDRPFILATDDMLVMATGTAFNVRNGSEYSTVSVKEGNVRVVPQSSAENTTDVQPSRTPPTRMTFENGATLSKGQQLRSNSDDSLTNVKNVDIDLVLSWRSGQLYFLYDDLATVFETATRYSDTKFQLTDQALRTTLYTGSFRTDSMDAWLKGMELNFNLRTTRMGSDWVVLTPAE